MEPFISHTGRVLPLRRSNVDTDQIIPAEYLKRVSRTGFGDGLFAAWREDPVVRPQRARLRRRDDPRRGHRLRHRLVARARRLGAGDYGFRVVIAPRFGDIFRSNATKAGLLPVRLPEDDGRRAAGRGSRRTRLLRSLSILRRVRFVARRRRIKAPFEIDDYTRWRLMEGLDDIGLTLRYADDVAVFEEGPPAWLPVTA